MDASRMADGIKYMWDGEEYASEADADAAAGAYKEKGFDILRVKEGDVSYLYTRRVVTDVKVEGSPTA